MKHDLTNKRFGRLVVLKEGEPRYSVPGKRVRTWDCLCDCGKTTNVIQPSLISGNTRSCGCGCVENRKRILNKAGVHKSLSHLYPRISSILVGMKQRCYNKNHTEYHRYGGRGITVCDEWMSKKEGTDNFIRWSLANGYKDNLTIDRIDNDKGYSPENCKWSDRYEQMSNTSVSYRIPYKGTVYNARSLAKKLNVSGSTIIKWYHRGNRTGEDIIKAIEKSIQIYPQTARFYGKKRAFNNK